MASSVTERIRDVDVGALDRREFSDLSVIEVAAKKIDALARANIDDRTEPRNPLSRRELQDLTGKSREEVTAIFKGKINSASTQGEAIALTQLYSDIEAIISTRMENDTLSPTWMSNLPLPNVEIFETEVAPEYGKAYMRHQLGLTGPGRGVEVKKEELQARLDTGFTKLGRLLEIGKHDTFSAHIGPNGNVHTLVLRRAVLNEDEVPTGEYGEKEYFDLTTDQGIKQLLSANTGSEVTEVPEDFRGNLAAVGKELEEVMDEISPRSNSASGPNFSSHSVNNLNGADPFAHVGSRVGQTLVDQNYLKTLLPLFEKHGLTNGDGTLNARGIRTFKEIVAARTLRIAEATAVSDKLGKARKQLNDLKKNDSLDHRSPEIIRQTKELEASIQELSRRENELKQVSEFAVSWMIVQLNSRVRVTIGDGPATTTMSIREVLELKEPRFTVHESGFDGDTNGKDLTPLTFRQKLASLSSIEFNQATLSKSRGWFQTAPDSTGFFKKRFAQKPLKTNEQMGGFEMGTLFYYPGIVDGESDASFRIQNQLRHERQGVGYTLCRDIPGVNEWVKLARNVVDIQTTPTGSEPPEDAVNALQSHFDPKVFTESQEDQQRLQAIVQGTLGKVGLLGFAPDTKTARGALDVLEKSKVVHDSRGRIGRFFHRNKS